VAIDSTLLRLPQEPELGTEFGWVACRNQSGKRWQYAQARLSLLYDVLNRIGVEARLVPWKKGERGLAHEHLGSLQATDLVLTDRGYSSYEWFARLLQAQRQFVCRCERSTFAAVQQLFEADQAGRSVQVTLVARGPQLKAIRAAAWPEQITIRLVTVRLAGGELEVLATSLLDEATYPTSSFAELYRLGHRDAFWSTQRQAEPGKLQWPNGGSHTARSPCHCFPEQSGDGDYTACRATSQRKESGAKVPRPSQPRGQFPCHKKRYP